MGLICSVQCPGSIVIKTFDAVRELRDSGIVVAGGFHSPMEKECLDFLLRGEQPVIVCPANSGTRPAAVYDQQSRERSTDRTRRTPLQRRGDSQSRRSRPLASREFERLAREPLGSSLGLPNPNHAVAESVIGAASIRSARTHSTALRSKGRARAAEGRSEFAILGRWW